jgi:predicted GIY-YIG superfamily endonuclease
MNMVTNKTRPTYWRKRINDQTTPKPSKAWAKKDEGVDAFYVYILRFDNGLFYIGHTRELRERMLEHKSGTTVSTSGKHPKLLYFEVLKTRTEAMIRESEIKKIYKKSNREILRMITRFYDLVRELDFE